MLQTRLSLGPRWRPGFHFIQLFVLDFVCPFVVCWWLDWGVEMDAEQRLKLGHVAEKVVGAIGRMKVE